MISLQLLLGTSFVSGHPGILLFNALQTLNIFAGYDAETKSPTPYSKFAHDCNETKSGEKKDAMMVSSRVGMMIIYIPAMITSMIHVFVLPLVFESMVPSLAGLMLLVHFVKRTLEVLFLHKYSGSTASNMAITIGIFYALITFMISSVSTTESDEVCARLGQAVFFIGTIGNFYHHYLLASLRSDTSSDRKYRPPKGGLFEYVATPHYLFELVAWAGIAIASQQMTGYLNFLSMSSYLCARSKNQNEWNRQKFDEKEWPESRKNLIPFLH